MATTHREGSVFHHEGGKVTHVESGAHPDPDRAEQPPAEPDPGPEAPLADQGGPGETVRVPEGLDQHPSKPEAATQPAKATKAAAAPKAPRSAKSGKGKR
jgi:hypothetical protein